MKKKDKHKPLLTVVSAEGCVNIQVLSWFSLFAVADFNLSWEVVESMEYLLFFNRPGK